MVRAWTLELVTKEAFGPLWPEGAKSSGRVLPKSRERGLPDRTVACFRNAASS